MRQILRLPLLLFVLATAAAAPPPTPEDFSIAGSRKIYERMRDDTLRFWTRPETDGENGRFRLWFDADGRPAAPEYDDYLLIPHLRMLFVQAAAIPLAGDDAERARLRGRYDLGFALLASFRDPATGLFAQALRPDGGRAPKPRMIDQAYAVMVFAELAARLSDHRALEQAQQTFAALDRYFHDDRHGGYFSELAGGDRATKNVGANQHAMYALARLLRVHPDRQCRLRLRELFDRLTDAAIAHPGGHLYQTVEGDWSRGRPLDAPAERQVMYGHNAEMVTYLAEAARVLGVAPDALLPVLRRIAAPILRDAVGRSGALAIFGPFAGPAAEPAEASYWCQLEFLNMLLTMYDFTGEAAYLDAYRRVAAFTFQRCRNPDNGVWYARTPLPAGRPKYQGGGDWKSGMHALQAYFFTRPIFLRQSGDAWRPPRRHRFRMPRRTIQISLGFPYNHRRSAESLVSEVVANGYDTILLIVKETEIRPAGLVEAAKKAGLQVYGSFFGASTFMPDALFPPESKQWRMEFTGPKSSNRYFSYVHDGYRQWYKRYLKELYDRHPFDGFVFYESYYGARAGRLAFGREPVFGDVSPGFARCFRQATGHARFPNFTDPASPDYYRNDPGLYRDFVEYRVQSVVDFHREIWDGEGGLRQLHPEVAFATWTIALAGDGALAEMREFQSQDGARLATELQPDCHFFQSHWPDWLPEKQPPSYVKDYAPYVRSVRDAAPAAVLAAQGDYASTQPYRRSPAWVAEFDRLAAETGFSFTTFYEFSVRYEVYFEAPKAVGGELGTDGRGVVVFDQRIAPESANALIGREATTARRITEAAVDGNLLNFRLSAPPEPGAKLTVRLDGLTGDPAVRVKMPGKGAGEANAVPAGRTITLTATP